jgi:RHS repeat-associated protein
VAQSDGTSTDYLAYDGLGSVRQVLDDAGTPLLTQTFDPYGNLLARGGTGESSFGFTGEQADANGLVYLRARYYAPGMGRFFQMDPSRQEQNSYRYGASNPIIFVDPSGLICINGQDVEPYGLPPSCAQVDAIRQTFTSMTTEVEDFIAEAIHSCSDLLPYPPGYYPSSGEIVNDAMELVQSIVGLEGLEPNIPSNFGYFGVMDYGSYNELDWSLLLEIWLGTPEYPQDRINRQDIYDTYLADAGEVTTVYRVIGTDELADLDSYGDYDISESEAKYFWFDEESAQWFAGSEASRSGQPQTITRTTIPTRFILAFGNGFRETDRYPAVVFRDIDTIIELYEVIGDIDQLETYDPPE